jgi:hypothetical protein
MSLILKGAAAGFAETLENLKHPMQPNPENLGHL